MIGIKSLTFNIDELERVLFTLSPAGAGKFVSAHASFSEQKGASDCCRTPECRRLRFWRVGAGRGRGSPVKATFAAETVSASPDGDEDAGHEGEGGADRKDFNFDGSRHGLVPLGLDERRSDRELADRLFSSLFER